MSGSEKLEIADLTALNAIAAGSNKKNPRIVAAGIGGKLMGTKSLVTVTAEQLTEDLKHNNSLSQEQKNKIIQDVKDAKVANEVKKTEDATKLHISEQPWTLNNWYKHVNWLNFVLVIAIPSYGLFQAFQYPPCLKTLVLAFVLYAFSGLSITAGYHRGWAHKAYEMSTPVKWFFALFGAGAIQGSVKWWAHGHRVHHRYTDTNKDPYDARKGFMYSHLTWMLTIPNPKHRARADISDLIADPVVKFQHTHYMALLLLMAFIVPTVTAGLFWGDYWGGFIYGGILKTFVIQQATFCVNSLAHWIGKQPFDDRRTPRDHALTALVTFGEGYHNFHHEFPSDYRNALKWYQYDPTKVTIYVLSKLGLAHNLRTFSQNAIDQGRFQQQQKMLDKMRTNLQWGQQVSELPVWDREEFNTRAKKEGLILISGIIHNVKTFIKEHPGGQAVVRASLGKDASEAFNGAVYAHSNAAHNLLANMRVAVLRDSNPNNNTFAVQQQYLDDHAIYKKLS
ncbi:stearoyl-CoA 9-desaturase [Yamadazyma tenuis]|uniref:Acyl-CoA desaturase n=1 Tax=Candida tenuis (strain ATCC 10573 / BCRC 21748 / CBS 615 / JCM 9827 / NBRC 10315 / NRRL Y-1498 / VKM Y-70) TaxID=590646 RepID=G3AW94_CANTC|nr:stearoyl-CoA desaturase [Yamadazyma tenuis ATCC 10573]EGV66490.1 stearoyl-CoA desaturase [Yamadazyma tenuis ATCC 10573]WEJ95398.1 stearoyl-CoA 9-desaturase [Yamadazyma tenuis]